MNILILSDLHIDACDHFGTFQWNELEFISQLGGCPKSLKNITIKFTKI